MKGWGGRGRKGERQGRQKGEKGKRKSYLILPIRRHLPIDGECAVWKARETLMTVPIAIPEYRSVRPFLHGNERE